MYRYLFLAVTLFGFASQVHAQAKASSMFDELTRDFGSVPRGQQLMHPFRIVNNTKQPVHISSVRVSCNRCSSVSILKNTLQPGEETAIIARMDTNQFLNTKSITIFVLFDQPRVEEVQLWMQANSRDDVTYSSDGIAFGRIKRGAEPESKLTITFVGGAQTTILETKSDSNYVVPVVKQVPRPDGEVAYEITAKLRKDTPAGKWYTDIWLKTNNNGIQKLRVPVTVEVEAPLSANPGTVSLGQVKAGAESEHKVIIRGVRPFRITNISGTDRFVQVRNTNDDSKAVHVLTVTLNPNEPGLLSRRITVQTDLANGGEILFEASAEVVP